MIHTPLAAPAPRNLGTLSWTFTDDGWVSDTPDRLVRACRDEDVRLFVIRDPAMPADVFAQAWRQDVAAFAEVAACVRVELKEGDGL